MMGNLEIVRAALLTGLLLLGPGCKCGAGPSQEGLANYARPKTEAVAKKKKVQPMAKRVRLTVVGADNLPDTDRLLFTGTIDPYIIVNYEGQRHETSRIRNKENPRWGDSFVLDLHEGGMLSLTLMDDDDFPQSDDRIGVVAVKIPPVQVGKSASFIASIRDGQGGVISLKVEGLSP
jgi:hypothetical protein